MIEKEWHLASEDGNDRDEKVGPKFREEKCFPAGSCRTFTYLDADVGGEVVRVHVSGGGVDLVRVHHAVPPHLRHHVLVHRGRQAHLAMKRNG